MKDWPRVKRDDKNENDNGRNQEEEEK